MTVLGSLGGDAEDRGDDVPAEIHLLGQVEQPSLQVIQMDPQLGEHHEAGPDIDRVGRRAWRPLRLRRAAR